MFIGGFRLDNISGFDSGILFSPCSKVFCCSFTKSRAIHEKPYGSVAGVAK